MKHKADKIEELPTIFYMKFIILRLLKFMWFRTRIHFLQIIFDYMRVSVLLLLLLLIGWNLVTCSSNCLLLTWMFILSVNTVNCKHISKATDSAEHKRKRRREQKKKREKLRKKKTTNIRGNYKMVQTKCFRFKLIVFYRVLQLKLLNQKAE